MSDKNKKLKFQDEVPEVLRKKATRVKSVGELVDVLSMLPKDLPLSNKTYVYVTRVVLPVEKLALAIDEYGF